MLYIKTMELMRSRIKDEGKSREKKEEISHTKTDTITHLSLASLLWDIGKQNSPRCDAAERGVPSGTVLFA